MSDNCTDMPSAGLLFLPDCAGCCPVRRRNASPGYQAGSGNPEGRLDGFNPRSSKYRSAVSAYRSVASSYLPSATIASIVNASQSENGSRYSMHILRDVRAVCSSAFPVQSGCFFYTFRNMSSYRLASMATQITLCRFTRNSPV